METLDPELLKQHQWTRLVTLVRAALPANRFLGAQFIEHFVNVQEAIGFCLDGQFDRIELDALEASTMSYGLTPPRAINQDAAHRFRSRDEKLRAIFPALLFLADDP